MSTISDTVTNEHSETIDMEDKTIGRLKDLLDSEIEHIRSVYEQSGYTKWALYGGIASIIWLIINRIENDSFNPMNVSILFLAFSLGFYVLLWLSILLESTQRNSDTEVRFRLTNRWYAIGRLSAMLFLAHIISMIVITYSVRGQVLWLFTTTVYVVYGLLALMLIGFFVITYFPYPLPLSQANTTVSIFMDLLIIVGSLIPSAAYLYHVNRSPTTATIDDYLIAALILALYYLLSILVGIKNQTPILKSLVITRRELLLGRMDVTTATQQIDVALTGLQVSDILQEDVLGLLELWRAFGIEMNQASKKAKAFRATIENVNETGKKASEHDASIVESLAESIQTHMDKGYAIIEEVDKQSQQFFRKSMWLAHSSKGANASVGKELKKIEGAAKETRRRFEEYEKEIETVMALAKDILRVKMDEGNIAIEENVEHQL